MVPLEKVKNLIDRHIELENQLSSGEIDKDKYAQISKEYSDLKDIIIEAKEYLKFKKETEDLKIIINDEKSDNEMKEFANNELQDLKKKFLINEKKNKNILTPKRYCR